jgi:hypothetical protein
MRSRALDFFIEPAQPRAAAPPRPHDGPVPQPAPAPLPAFAAPVASARPRAATRMPLRAAVLGSAVEAVPVGALLANALRSAEGAATATLAVPGGGGARGGPATLAASRLAARLSARGLPAAARGRLAWMALEDHPVAAAVAARRAASALEVPLVVVLCGPRCDVVEALLAEQDLVVIVAADPDGPLARLAVASCTTAALACAPPPPGPPRWAARSGMPGARGLAAPLRSLVHELAAHPAPEAVEVAW